MSKILNPEDGSTSILKVFLFAFVVLVTSWFVNIGIFNGECGGYCKIWDFSDIALGVLSIIIGTRVTLNIGKTILIFLGIGLIYWGAGGSEWLCACPISNTGLGTQLYW